MANQEHLNILAKGVGEWNEWRKREGHLVPDLTGAVLTGVMLQCANLTRARLEDAYLRNANLKGANLENANLEDANLENANLKGANLNHAYLKGANLEDTNLNGADLRQVNLENANLKDAILENTNLESANLEDANLVLANLTHANLTHANLTGAILEYAILEYANLEYAILEYANLEYAILEYANLKNAHLDNANLDNANLTRANLTRADLTRANFASADLTAVDLTCASLSSTVFAFVDLGTAKGLDTIRHDGPSIVGIETLYKSQNRIPESFLRGMGIPDNFITHMNSLSGAPIEFYSCFISYSAKDQNFVDRLHADLQWNGVRCWFAPHDVQSGKKLFEQIDEAIRRHDKLLLILSESSMNSEWVATEISNARKRERQEQRRVLFPVRLVPYESLSDWVCFDSDIGKDSAREIREYFIPDFSNWKAHDSYAKAFNRLLRDLKAEDDKRAAPAPSKA